MQFAQLLNHIRVKEHTAHDVQLVEAKKSASTNLSNTLHVYAKNFYVDSHNLKQLRGLTHPIELTQQ